VRREHSVACLKVLWSPESSLDGVTALEVAPIIRTVKRAATVVPAD
jgi:hypothetical protein